MFRIFGIGKSSEVPKKSLDDLTVSQNLRVNELDTKIKGLDQELGKYKEQLKKSKSGTSAKKQLEQRAMNVLKQKRMYEKQREQLNGQIFNIDQTKFATQNIKDNADMVSAMKSTHAELKESFKEINIDEVENLHDDMSDLLEDADEINDILGRTYGVPENIDEDDLMNELNALDDEIALDDTIEEEVPSYLQQKTEVKESREVSLPSLPNAPINASSSTLPVNTNQVKYPVVDRLKA